MQERMIPFSAGYGAVQTQRESPALRWEGEDSTPRCGGPELAITFNPHGKGICAREIELFWRPGGCQLFALDDEVLSKYVVRIFSQSLRPLATPCALDRDPAP